VAVEAEENPQAMFYIAAALHTTATKWAFKDVEAIDVYIVQPPFVKKWTTDLARIKRFEADLILAVRASEQPDAPLKTGDHCRWCAAKSVCPLVTGVVARADRAALKTINVDDLAAALDRIELVKGWIKDAEDMAQALLENGTDVPGYKLVAKRATRQWANEAAALTALTEAGCSAQELTELKSPAQVEKVLKKRKVDMPEGLITAVSSGNTLASADDPRPAVLQIGKQLASALGKLV
jgi:hypothetical protein